MAFEIRVDLAQSQQFFARKRSGFGPGGIKDRRGMALREHEDIAVAVVWIARIVTHHGIEKDRHDLCRGAAARRVAAAGFGCGTDGIDPQASRLVLEGFERNAF